MKLRGDKPDWDQSQPAPVFQATAVEHCSSRQTGRNCALDQIIGRDKCLFILGPSGCGKSTPGRLASNLVDELPRLRDRHSPECLAIEARILQEMPRHGVNSD